MTWIVDSMVIQPDQMDPFVHRHSTVSTVTRQRAVEIVRQLMPGRVSIVGYIEDGRSHYFPGQA